MLYKYRPTTRSNRSNSYAIDSDLSRFTKNSIFTVDLFYIYLPIRRNIVTISENLQTPKRHFTSRKELRRADQSTCIFSYFIKNFYTTKHNHCSSFLRHNVHSSIIFPTDSSVKLICRRRRSVIRTSILKTVDNTILNFITELDIVSSH